jgi:hypothetical protein
MHDDMKAALTAALEAETATPWPDLEWVLRRGGRIRILRSVTIALVTIAVVGAAAGSASLLTGADGRDAPKPASPDETSETFEPSEPDRAAPVIEETTEQERAEIFAFRALAATGVMTPLGEHTYTWTSEEHTTRIDDAWKVGFAASDCAPREGPEGQSQTCRPVGGEDPRSGNARGPDTFVHVERDGNVWRVVGLDGVIRAEHRDRVVGYELPHELEESHWELPAISIWRITDDERSVQMWPLWVGPFPTDAPGSVCELQALDGEGRPVGDAVVYYVEPPAHAYSRMGWVMGRGAGTERPFEDAEATCHQYTGRGWEVEHGPDLIGQDGGVIGVSASLVWRGDRGFTAAAVCRATLVDEDGATLWEGTGKALALWRPGELKDYPYRTDVTVTTDGETVRADAIGDFECETR